MGRLDSKVALITGAARGTGAAAARVFVEEGARVVVGDVLEAEGRAVADSLGDPARFVRLDVRDAAGWRDAVAATQAAFGPLDVLVNNAAVFLLQPLAQMTAEEFEEVLRVNLLGPVLGMQAAARAMGKRGGAIVNVASTDATRGREMLAAYVASKWGLRGLTKAAALELGRAGIRVNAVCPEAGSVEFIQRYLPPGVDAERMLAAGHQRVATQERRSLADRLRDVAHVIAFLASDEAASCSGAEFVVDNAATAGERIEGLPGR